MISRSVRSRRAASAAAALAARTGGVARGNVVSFRRRRTRTGQIMPAGGARSYLYGSGVAGTTRYVRAAPGRDVPLYVAPRRVSYEEMRVFPNPALDANPVLTGLSFANNFVLVHLNPIRQADDIAARQGGRAQLQSLLLRGTIRIPTGSPTLNVQYGTLMVIYDRSPNGQLPLITDVLQAPVTPPAFARVDYRDRFSILYRQQLILENTPFMDTTTPATPVRSNVATSDSARIVDLVIPIHRPAVYSDTAATGVIATMRTGALYLACIGTSAVPSENLTGDFVQRIAFSDL